MRLFSLLLILPMLCHLAGAGQKSGGEPGEASLAAKVESEEAHFSIQGHIKGGGESASKTIYGATFFQVAHATSEKVLHRFSVKVDAIQNTLREVTFVLGGEGEIKSVTSESLEDWSVRQSTAGSRLLVVRFKKTEKPLTTVNLGATGETILKEKGATNSVLTLSLEQASLANGYVLLTADPGLSVEPVGPTGLVPIELKLLPSMEPLVKTGDPAASKAFRFLGAAYSLPMVVGSADPEAGRVVFRDVRLTGSVSGAQATFTLAGVARVKDPKGGELRLLSGAVALTSFDRGTDWRLRFENGSFVAHFEKPGDYPIELKFDALIQSTNGWQELDFTVASSTLVPVTLSGFKPDTHFNSTEGAKPEFSGSKLVSFLPPNGRFKLSWREKSREKEGVLFFSTEGLSQITVTPSVMRQKALFDFKVMQGELNTLTFMVRGEGDITRVAGPQVLSWSLDSSGTNRQLTVRLNQVQKDRVALEIQSQTPLGAFPQTARAIQFLPQGATRVGGHFRISNQGAVRLEIIESTGLSQIAPEQFPKTEQSKVLPVPSGSQVFAFRYSGGAFDLRIQADSIVPEISVSQLLLYHLAETELRIDAEIELDIREAPVREVTLRVPAGYAIARLNASGLSDYFLSTNAPESGSTQLRIVYSSPLSDRQLIQLSLERNSALGTNSWALPRIEVARAKSLRGHVGVSSAPGYRLIAGLAQGLTEIDTAFYPKKVTGLQVAFRINDPAWQGSINVEPLPQSVQVDAFHLFSVGEGIAYGSTLLNYVISGAPVSSFRVALTNDYFNVEFTGKDVRNWQKIEGGYVVQLHTPVTGTYPLLATYERPFRNQGETLRFIGGQALDVQSEQGYTVVVGTYQFQVRPVNVSAGLQQLEPGELPAEYRLFFDAPILAAYRYTSRPFNLQLELTPLAQAENLSQVIDRAAYVTRVSKDGQVLTDVRLFVKNKTSPNLRLVAPNGAQLWSVSVNGREVVPVVADGANLIPLPTSSDPNTSHEIQIKLASKAADARRISITTPALSAPILLNDWRIEPETGQRLRYEKGSLLPAEAPTNDSGFLGLYRAWKNGSFESTWGATLALLVFLIIGVFTFRLASTGGTSKGGFRHVSGALIGTIAFLLAAGCFVFLARSVESGVSGVSGAIHFVVPIQQANSSLNVALTNLPAERSIWEWAGVLWPALIGAIICLWALARFSNSSRRAVMVCGWLLVFWGILSTPNSVAIFLGALGLFVLFQVIIPCLTNWLRVPRRPAASATGGLAVRATALLFAGLLAGSAYGEDNVPEKRPISADRISQDIRIVDEVAFATARLEWNAIKGEVLPLLATSAVLTKLDFPADAVRVAQSTVDGESRPALIAQKTGPLTIEFQYQVPVTRRGSNRGFILPTEYALVNELKLAIAEPNAELVLPQAVSVRPEPDAAGTQSVFHVVIAPREDRWIAWHPRARNTSGEKARFFAELTQLYVPAAGLIEGSHLVQIRPAQGQLDELSFEVPADMTITDVAGQGVSLWRFDPSARRLRVELSPALSKPFSLIVSSQKPTGPLPIESTLGLLKVLGAADQVGFLGVATGSEVQLDDLPGNNFGSVNLEDFPASTLDPLRARVPGLTLRRTFRYTQSDQTLTLRASAVQPDVRVESQQTLSLGDDRIVLAVNLNVLITRAGVFKLSFVLPPGLDVESISGPSMSHWTEVKIDQGRLITLDLKSRTEGQQQFSATLVGPGIKNTNNWPVPRFVLREAAKQTGQIFLVPEQGTRIQVTNRVGVTQIDPGQSGVRQKGVVAFRILQTDWRLNLDLERVDAWTQVTSLQQALCEESTIKVAGNLLYEIENAGLKALTVRLPATAEGVRFRGDQVTDFVPQNVLTNAAVRDWRIKLARRVSGKFLLHLEYSHRLPEGGTNFVLSGIEAQDVNLQRGFVQIQSGNRIQVRVSNLPGGLQIAEPQSIPRGLLAELPATTADHTFRLVEPAFQLALRLERHEAARLLPARVTNVELKSVVADNGIVLTQVRVEMIPGDKRLLRLAFPPNASFWFAFVNQNSVWPWRDAEGILIPLEQHSKTRDPVLLEFFYSSTASGNPGRRLELALAGPRFDLPLENIVWNVFLDQKWHVKHWDGTLELREQAASSYGMPSDLETYRQQETVSQQVKSREAEQFLSLANSLLQKGNPEEARHAFQNAYGLSQHDSAFNEDARVQLHNLKTQQALVGLNVRQARVGGAGGSIANAPRNLRDGNDLAYTQQEAKQLLERNTAEDNAAQMRLIERVIQQQEAIVAKPAAIHASFPEQGRKLTFQRSLQVETNSDLRILISAKQASDGSSGYKALVLASIGLFAIGFTVLANRPPERMPATASAIAPAA